MIELIYVKDYVLKKKSKKECKIEDNKVERFYRTVQINSLHKKHCTILSILNGNNTCQTFLLLANAST